MGKGQTHFHFKQFSIDHAMSSMKVGTDGVLLGAWVNLRDTDSVLDIGTGSGLIALMMAQRSSSNCLIDAVEIAERDAAAARVNVGQSPWPKKVTVHHTAIQRFDVSKQYGVIVSNPPYFMNSYMPTDAGRQNSRHTAALTYADLLQSVDRLLQPDGCFNLILPATEGIFFQALAESFGLYCSRRWHFRPRAEKPVERYLMEFQRSVQACEQGEIVMYRHAEIWDKSYQELTRDFYLKF